MNLNILSPWIIHVWQSYGVFVVIAGMVIGFLVRHSHVKKVKRRELLKELHKSGEVELVSSEFTVLALMDELAIDFMLKELVTEGIIYLHIVKVLRSNRWESYPVYRLTHPKGVELATTMFDSAPTPPPDSG